MKTLLVTGGCGFIGSNFILQELAKANRIVNLDSLSYAANPDNLKEVTDNASYVFVRGSINDQRLVESLLDRHDVDAVVNFAAESHVDNSIEGPEVFVQTNVLGTYHLLQAALKHWHKGRKPDFRFLHVSTDEVFGDLPLGTDDKFTENTPYKPSSPYSASKAGSDHLVHAWHRTYKLPALITNCSNNFGPRQHREKLIPTMITSALAGKTLPVYGKGENVRDWIYVDDHCRGVALALEKGRLGESYCFGGGNEIRNIDLVKKLCAILDTLKPADKPYAEQIGFVTDRPGHDLRYAIDDSKARRELGYVPQGEFEDQLKKTVKWYLHEGN